MTKGESQFWKRRKTVWNQVVRQGRSKSLPRKIGDLGRSWKSGQTGNTAGTASHPGYYSKEWHNKMFHFLRSFFKIEIQLAYSIMLASGILHWGFDICIHYEMITVSLLTSLPVQSDHSIIELTLYAVYSVTYVLYNWRFIPLNLLHLFCPTPKPILSDNHPFVLSLFSFCF